MDEISGCVLVPEVISTCKCVRPVWMRLVGVSWCQRSSVHIYVCESCVDEISGCVLVPGVISTEISGCVLVPEVISTCKCVRAVWMRLVGVSWCQRSSVHVSV